MIKAIICRGIGFSLGTISYIPTHGFSIGIATNVLIHNNLLLKLQ